MRGSLCQSSASMPSRQRHSSRAVASSRSSKSSTSSRIGVGGMAVWMRTGECPPGCNVASSESCNGVMSRANPNSVPAKRISHVSHSEHPSSVIVLQFWQFTLSPFRSARIMLGSHRPGQPWLVGVFSCLSWLYGISHMRLNSAISCFDSLGQPHGLTGGRSRFGGLNGLTLILAR